MINTDRVDSNELTEIQLITLKSLADIGLKKATEALIQLINIKARISIAEAKLIPVKSIPEFSGGSENEVVGIYLKMLGDISGSVLFTFTPSSAHFLTDMMMDRCGNEKDSFSELEESALKELGNILSNIYFNVIAEMLEIKVFSSVPYFARDMFGAIMDFILIKISKVSDYAMVIKANFEVRNRKIEGNFFIFPDEDSLNLIFRKLGAN